MKSLHPTIHIDPSFKSRSWQDLFSSYKKLVRPTVVYMGLTNGLVGVMYAQLSSSSLFYAIIALITIAAIAAFSYGYNQLTDLDEDRINAPHRPLVTGELSVKEAKVFLTILLMISTVPLLLTGRFIALALMLAGPVFSGVTYSLWRVKSTIIKPFFVAFGWSFVPLIAYSTVTNTISPMFVFFLPFFLILMFLTTTMGDLRDVAGDIQNDVRSLPVVFGVRPTIINLQIYTVLNYSILVVGIILGILPIYAVLGLYGGVLLFRHVRTDQVLSRQKGLKNSLARFSWITSIGLVIGQIIAILL
jgi:4-hydroxybenzoate polyprenyltransferase